MSTSNFARLTDEVVIENNSRKTPHQSMQECIASLLLEEKPINITMRLGERITQGDSDTACRFFEVRFRLRSTQNDSEILRNDRKIIAITK